jgi:hypothetical protein
MLPVSLSASYGVLSSVRAFDCAQYYAPKRITVKCRDGCPSLTGIMPRVQSSLRNSALMLGLIALMLAPRLIGLDLFATVDEPYWLTAGSDFYYALGQRDFAKTVYDYHPAVTTMWIVTTGMLLYFPQYRGLGQGYFDVYKDSLEQFLLAHDHTPLGLLATSRLVQVVLIALLLVLVFILLRRLLDERTAVVAVLLLSFDPFLLGHSRLLNHEVLMTLFAMVAVLGLLTYLLRGQEVGWLMVSGAAAGLAQLTKSPSVVVIPVAVMLMLGTALPGPRSELRNRLGRSLRQCGIWLAAMAAIYFALWPGMWVAPGTMLQEVFGNAVNYAVAGARLSATGAEPAIAAPLHFEDVGLYVQSMLWRTTPVAWLGLVLCAFAAWKADGQRRLVLLTLAAMGILFVLLFGLASGRNSAHYVMLTYAVVDILAGAGFVWATTWIAGRLHSALGELTNGAILTAAVAAQALSAAAFFPYYYTYFNPLMEAAEAGRQNPNFGYGEGLDLAAGYLEAKPGAADTKVMAFYGRGPFSYFFSGRTEPLKTIYGDAENVPQLLQLLRRSDYLVIYSAIQQGRQTPANVMRALQGMAPEKTIWLNGIEYARIYAVEELPPEFFEQLTP